MARTSRKLKGGAAGGPPARSVITIHNNKDFVTISKIEELVDKKEEKEFKLSPPQEQDVEIREELL